MEAAVSRWVSFSVMLPSPTQPTRDIQHKTMSKKLAEKSWALSTQKNCFVKLCTMNGLFQSGKMVMRYVRNTSEVDKLAESSS